MGRIAYSHRPANQKPQAESSAAPLVVRQVWSIVQRRNIAEALRKRESFDMIAADMTIGEAALTTPYDVYHLIFKASGGIQKFLSLYHDFSHEEVRELKGFYGTLRAPEPSGQNGGASKRSHETLGPIEARERTHEVLHEGIKRNLSFSRIAQMLSNRHGIQMSVDALEKLIRTHRGLEEFLEHAGESKVAALAIATGYKNQCGDNPVF